MAKACLRILICIVNIVYALIAAALAYVVYLFSVEIQLLKDSRNYEKYQLDYDIYWPQVIPWIFGAAALAAIFVAIIGFFGAGFDSKSVSATYIGLAVISILALIGAGVTGVIKTERMVKQVNETILDVFTHSLEKKEIRQEFDRIERLLRCCGAMNQNEYAGIGLPASCCDKGTECHFTKRNGCVVVVTDYSSWAVFWYGTVICGVLSILILASLTLSLILVMWKRRDNCGVTKSLKFSSGKTIEANC